MDLRANSPDDLLDLLLCAVPGCCPGASDTSAGACEREGVTCGSYERTAVGRKCGDHQCGHDGGLGVSEPVVLKDVRRAHARLHDARLASQRLGAGGAAPAVKAGAGLRVVKKDAVAAARRAREVGHRAVAPCALSGIPGASGIGSVL